MNLPLLNQECDQQRKDHQNMSKDVPTMKAEIFEMPNVKVEVDEMSMVKGLVEDEMLKVKDDVEQKFEELYSTQKDERDLIHSVSNEMQQRETKKKNLVIFGLEESNDDGSMVQKLVPMKLKATFRVGKKESSTTAKTTHSAFLLQRRMGQHIFNPIESGLFRAL